MYQISVDLKLAPVFRMAAVLVVLSGAWSVLVLAQEPKSSQSVSTLVTCVSKQGERIVCPADTSAGVALQRSLGDASCLLGKNWGYDSQGIWVAEGCGAEFIVGSTKEADWGKDFVGLFQVYGQWRIQLAAYQDEVQVQDNASRVGINFATRGKIKMFAGTEWGVNLVQSETQFNLSAAAPGEFGAIGTLSFPVFTARLGFLGVDLGAGGKIGIGKQYGVQYDIGSYTTDRFNVFGGQGSSTYVAGTDGGATGTGRADRIVYYRNTLAKIVEVAVQGQFRGLDTGSGSGVGGSLQVTVLPGVKLGGTYTRTDFGERIEQDVIGLGGDADYMAAGARADWRNLALGFVYSHEHNGDLVQFPTDDPLVNVPVAFDAWGVEVYGRVGLGRFGLIGGYITQMPKTAGTPLNPNFKTRYFILGGEWFVAKNAKIYSDNRINVDGVSATGVPSYGVFTIGFRYDFSWSTSHQP